MNQEKFWAIIKTTIENYHHTMASYLEELAFQLEMLPKEEVALWENYFDAYMELANKEKLWAGAFILNKGECSDDHFDTFRAWLISMGEDYYFEILEHVDNLADLIVSQPEHYVARFEEIMYVGQDVLMAKFSRNDSKIDAEEAYFDYLEDNSLSQVEQNVLYHQITYDRNMDAEWDEHTVKHLKPELPKLFAKYWKYLDKKASKWELSTHSDDFFSNDF